MASSLTGAKYHLNFGKNCLIIVKGTGILSMLERV